MTTRALPRSETGRATVTRVRRSSEAGPCSCSVSHPSSPTGTHATTCGRRAYNFPLATPWPRSRRHSLCLLESGTGSSVRSTSCWVAFEDRTMSSNLPDKPSSSRSLDRAALERVLARASELQAGTGEAGESMTEEQLIELGKEVGLSPEHVRQAIAEEATRVAVQQPEGQTSGVFGPTTAWAQRVITGSQADVLPRIDRYMQNEESLTVRRRFADRVTWEARRDMVGSIKRGFGIGGRRYALARADETGATVVPVDNGRVLVRLDATFPGSSMPIAMLIGGVWAAMGGAGFAAIAKSYRLGVKHAQLALEQALDRLEHGEPPRRDSLFD